MKERFQSFEDMIEAYQRAKLKAGSARSVSMENLGDDTHKQSSVKDKQSRQELQLAFICDVEKFLTHHNNCQENAYVPIPMVCWQEMFNFMFCSGVTSCKSYGELALRMKALSRKRQVPRRLLNRSNLHNICRDMEKAARRYFGF